MARTIWKFPLSLNGPQPQWVRMPKDSKVLFVGMQQEICIWAEVYPKSATEQRWFAIHGTGHELADVKREYLGSVCDAPFVWHVFEVSGDAPREEGKA